MMTRGSACCSGCFRKGAKMPTEVQKLCAKEIAWNVAHTLFSRGQADRMAEAIEPVILSTVLRWVKPDAVCNPGSV